MTVGIVGKARTEVRAAKVATVYNIVEVFGERSVWLREERGARRKEIYKRYFYNFKLFE